MLHPSVHFVSKGRETVTAVLISLLISLLVPNVSHVLIEVIIRGTTVTTWTLPI